MDKLKDKENYVEKEINIDDEKNSYFKTFVNANSMNC